VIFSGSFYMTGAVLLSLLLSFTVFKRYSHPVVGGMENLWFWFAVVFYTISLFLVIYRFKMRFFETFEASAVGILLWFIVVFVSFSLSRPTPLSLLSSLYLVFLPLLFLYLDKKYKNISWYKSGKVGFSGLFTLGIFFLTRSLVAIASFPVLSLSGRFDIVLSAAMSFLLFFAVYNLSQLK